MNPLIDCLRLADKMINLLKKIQQASKVRGHAELKPAEDVLEGGGLLASQHRVTHTLA